MADLLENVILIFHDLVQKNKMKFYFRLIGYFTPIVLLIWFVSSYSINVPVGDHYDLISLFEKIQQGTANYKDFFLQHNEHRIVFPKIIFSILAFTSKWNVNFETFFSVLITLFSFYLIYRIAELSQDKKQKNLFHLFNIVTCFYIFSLTQMENWLWGFQISWFMMNTFIVVAIFLLTVPKNLSPKVKVLSSAGCCFLASFSMTHGLFSWFALIPSVLSVNGNSKQKRGRLLLWGIFFILCCFIYSIGYDKPSTSPDLFYAFKNPLTTIVFFLKLLGTPIISKYLNTVFGLIILSSFIFFNVYFITKYRSEFSRQAVPWISMGWFALIFSLITTVGRVGLGIDYALAPKYTTVTILLIISCLQMWRILISQGILPIMTGQKVSYVMVGFLITLLLGSYSRIIPGWNLESRVYRNGAKTCLEVIYYLDESLLQQSNLNNCIWFLYRNHLSLENLKDYAQSLEKLKFRDFPQDLQFVTEPTKIFGKIDSPSQTSQPLTLSNSETLTINGWAMPREDAQMPIVVLFSSGNNQSFFASAFVRLKRPEIKEDYNLTGSSKIGWQTEMSLKSLPLGENVIKAWIYVPKERKFMQLNNEVKVKVIAE